MLAKPQSFPRRPGLGTDGQTSQAPGRQLSLAAATNLHRTYSPTWDKRTHTARLGVVHRGLPSITASLSWEVGALVHPLLAGVPSILSSASLFLPSLHSTPVLLPTPHCCDSEKTLILRKLSWLLSLNPTGRHQQMVGPLQDQPQRSPSVTAHPLQPLLHGRVSPADFRPSYKLCNDISRGLTVCQAPC